MLKITVRADRSSTGVNVQSKLNFSAASVT